MHKDVEPTWGSLKFPIISLIHHPWSIIEWKTLTFTRIRCTCEEFSLGCIYLCKKSLFSYGRIKDKRRLSIIIMRNIYTSGKNHNKNSFSPLEIVIFIIVLCHWIVNLMIIIIEPLVCISSKNKIHSNKYRLSVHCHWATSTW